MDTDRRLEITRRYLQLELPITPCPPKGQRIGKHIATGKGCYERGWNDPGRFFGIENFKPDYNTGLRLGYPSPYGYFMELDWDNPDIKTLLDFLAQLEKHDSNLSDTLIVKSGGDHDGYKIFYRTNRPIKTNINAVNFHGVKIEIRTNGQAIIPPSHIETEYTIYSPQLELFDPQYVKHIDPQILFTYLEQLPQWDKETRTVGPTFTEIISTEQATTNKYLIVVAGVKNERFDTIWDEMIRTAYKYLYGVPLRVALDIEGYRCSSPKILCVLRKETNPSANLYRADNGVILYRCWGNHGCSKDYYTLQDVFTLLHDKSTTLWHPDRNRESYNVWAGRQTRKIFKRFGFLNEQALEIRTWFEGIVSDLERKLDHRIVAAMKKITEYAIECASCNDYPFVGAARYMKDVLGADKGQTNRTMNYLTALGLLEKCDGKKCKLGVADTWEMGVAADIDGVLIRRDQLRKAGIMTARDFNKDRCKAALGQLIADRIVRRDPDPE